MSVDAVSETPAKPRYSVSRKGMGGVPPKQVPEDKAEKILEQLARGTPLTVICDNDSDLPTWRAVYDWLKKDAEFASAFADARDTGWDRLAYSALEIADTPARVTFPDGRIVESDSSRDKLRVWTRLELLKVWDPKRYAAIKKVDVSGELNVQHSVSQVDVRTLAPHQRDAIREVLLAIEQEEAQPVIEGDAFAPDDYA